jgi:CheY-like chemotaxis protein
VTEDKFTPSQELLLRVAAPKEPEATDTLLPLDQGTPLESIPSEAGLLSSDLCGQSPGPGQDSLPTEACTEDSPKALASKIRIALIDDEPSVLFALKLLLEALGVAIADFSAPEQALKHLSTPDVADVCLCDLRMPKRNGLQVLEEVKKLFPQLPFILMSAHASDAELQKARMLGANGVLTKPFTPDDLQAVLASVR